MGDFTVIGVTGKALKSLIYLNLKETFDTSFPLDNITSFSLREVERKFVDSNRRKISIVESVEDKVCNISFKNFLWKKPPGGNTCREKRGDPIVECLPKKGGKNDGKIRFYKNQKYIESAPGDTIK